MADGPSPDAGPGEAGGDPAERERDGDRSLARRAVDLLLRLGARARRPLPPAARRVALAVAGLGFVVGAWLALGALEVDPATIRWTPLVIAAVIGVPFSAVVNAAEYAVSARILGHRVPLRDAMSVTVMATAANLLPIPGSTLVRVQGLRQQGSGYGRATAVTVAIGAAWVGVSAALAGVWLLAGRVAGSAVDWLSIAGFGLGGLAVLATVPLLIGRSDLDAAGVRRWTGGLVVLELASVSSAVLRLVLVLEALGAGGGLTAAVVLSVSAALASAAGVFPGGLGLREALAGAFAPLVGLSFAAGFAASAVNRVIGMIVHIPVAGLMVAAQRRRRRGGPEGPDARRTQTSRGGPEAMSPPEGGGPEAVRGPSAPDPGSRSDPSGGRTSPS